MAERQWEIGICGTFDVANYGDLLFPVIAKAELTKRLGAVTFHPFSYHAKSPPEWPYRVASVNDLSWMVHQLDGLIIGGGLIIRFDKNVAPGYFPSTSEVHHPTGYWLTPALIALQHNVPVVWNAPGLDGNDIPAWARTLLEKALKLSSYVSVRDEPSRLAIDSLTSEPIAVVPDTAFGLPRLLDLAATPSAEYTRLREAAGLDRPYIVVQARSGMEGFVRFINKHAERLRDFRFLALPIGPVLGDRDDFIAPEAPGALVRLPCWPSPLVLAELIGRSEAVAGQSYHLFVTALAAGVPVFTRDVTFKDKYSVLARFDSVFQLPRSGEPDLDWFLERVGRTAPSPAALATLAPLCRHWDRIATAFQLPSEPTAPALNKFWQSLPALLENGAAAQDELAIAQGEVASAHGELAAAQGQLSLAQEQLAATQEQLAWKQQQLAAGQAQLTTTQERLIAANGRIAECQDRLSDSLIQLTVAHADVGSRDAQIAEIGESLSWKLTAPLRFAGRSIRKQTRRRLMHLASIWHGRMETDPFEWAAINHLFTANDAAALAGTYPSDHFKLVAASNREREYEYEARSLIAMGSNVIADPGDLSDAWRALAVDLLSPEYRAAMTTLTGRDLSRTPMEVNVFHYGPGGNLSPHRDLPDKIVTHVLYFNPSWNAANGGCLRILRSSDTEDVASELPPIAGYSSVLVRSEKSWHAVSPVARDLKSSRRSVTITFYHPGSVSTLWPPGDTTPLHRYEAPDLA